jgi:hypothetical protein
MHGMVYLEEVQYSVSDLVKKRQRHLISSIMGFVSEVYHAVAKVTAHHVCRDVGYDVNRPRRWAYSDCDAEVRSEPTQSR